MTILRKTVEKEHTQIEALRRRLLDTCYEHHGIPEDERQTYSQLDVAVCLAAVAPMVAALLVTTRQPDAAAEQFMDLVHYFVRHFQSNRWQPPMLSNFS